MPQEKKTIKNVSVGGVAGGEKYAYLGSTSKLQVYCRRDFFQSKLQLRRLTTAVKFAIDVIGLYGSDEYAM